MQIKLDLKNIKAIIFDFDGIIVDSEPVQMRAFRETLKPYGIEISNEEFFKMIGIRTVENFKEIKEKYNLNETIESLVEKKNENYLRLLLENLKPRECIPEVVKYLYSRGYLLGVGSGSRKEDVVIPLEKLGLNKFFKVIITGDDAVYGKPSPEIFLKVARNLNVKPQECAVIEDSENGVLAALNAGMIAVAVPTEFTRTHNLSRAHILLKSICEIKNLF